MKQNMENPPKLMRNNSDEDVRKFLVNVASACLTLFANSQIVSNID